MTSGFENSRRVPLVPPPRWDEPDPAATLRAAREATRLVLAFATASRRPDTTGRRMLALAFAAGALPDCSTQRDLARLLGVTPAAVCKLIAEARAALRSRPVTTPAG